MLYHYLRKTKVPFNHTTYRTSTKICKVYTQHELNISIGGIANDRYHKVDFKAQIINKDWYEVNEIAEAIANKTKNIVIIHEIGHKNRNAIVWNEN